MALKLHRCGNLWAKFGGHPCWKVQKALDDAGVEYEIVKEPWPSRKKRTAVIEGTGQSGLPAIELEDGTLVPQGVGRHGADDPGRQVRLPRAERRRAGGRLTAGGRRYNAESHGAIAQLGERLDRTQEVSGSSPLGSTETPAEAGVFSLRKALVLPLFSRSATEKCGESGGEVTVRTRRTFVLRRGRSQPGIRDRARPDVAARPQSGVPTRK